MDGEAQPRRAFPALQWIKNRLTEQRRTAEAEIERCIEMGFAEVVSRDVAQDVCRRISEALASGELSETAARRLLLHAAATAVWERGNFPAETSVVGCLDEIASAADVHGWADVARDVSWNFRDSEPTPCQKRRLAWPKAEYDRVHQRATQLDSNIRGLAYLVVGVFAASAMMDEFIFIHPRHPFRFVALNDRADWLQCAIDDALRLGWSGRSLNPLLHTYYQALAAELVTRDSACVTSARTRIRDEVQADGSKVVTSRLRACVSEAAGLQQALDCAASLDVKQPSPRREFPDLTPDPSYSPPTKDEFRASVRFVQSQGIEVPGWTTGMDQPRAEEFLRSGCRSTLSYPGLRVSAMWHLAQHYAQQTRFADALFVMDALVAYVADLPKTADHIVPSPHDILSRRQWIEKAQRDTTIVIGTTLDQIIADRPSLTVALEPAQQAVATAIADMGGVSEAQLV